MYILMNINGYYVQNPVLKLESYNQTRNITREILRFWTEVLNHMNPVIFDRN